MPAQDTELRVFYSDEPLPDGAEDLFGAEARAARTIGGIAAAPRR